MSDTIIKRVMLNEKGHAQSIKYRKSPDNWIDDPAKAKSYSDEGTVGPALVRILNESFRYREYNMVLRADEIKAYSERKKATEVG